MTTDSGSTLWQRPATRLGQWAVGLWALFVLLFIINSFVFMPAGENPANEWWMHAYLPFYGIFMLLCGFASGVIGLIAVLRKGERSWLVWLTLLPGAWVIFMLLGEFLVPH